MTVTARTCGPLRYNPDGSMVCERCGKFFARPGGQNRRDFVSVVDELEQSAEYQARNRSIGMTVTADIFTLKMARRVRGDRAAVAPGLLGRMVQSVNGTWNFPTVVLGSIADTRRWIARQRAKGAR